MGKREVPGQSGLFTCWYLLAKYPGVATQCVVLPHAKNTFTETFKTKFLRKNFFFAVVVVVF